ncbi:M48 family metallopeptidase [Alkalilimnicola sp. S0819]|uniref:M48 family metallopeptidase n=1 Tax=Alkalilimnicola sp. S0819 TaxID=2613922 RepID=UPI00126220BA|nr:SprT family zinc-dependent metalloprotease [Alkalilimnicola sp. S0819]KAB7623690.1 M48 family metallopeptidase [Alkalilimnicola sp. S0819]MPQ16818.1 DUF45 domain-containing protein [Alkalilimnicola sp. S0819]
MSGDTRTLRRDGHRIDYTLRRSRRRSIGLYLHPDGRVELRAPMQCSAAEAEGFLLKKLDWLLGKQAELQARPRPEPLRFENGARHPYLGERYPLRARLGPKGGEFTGGAIVLRLRRPDDPAALREALHAWYRQQARQVFAERLAACHGALAHWGIPLPELGLRWMRSRWGSCSSRGRVNLNLELIKQPLACIDYVIVHELCHLREFNHSPRFYALMDEALPDWRERKARLAAGT